MEQQSIFDVIAAREIDTSRAMSAVSVVARTTDPETSREAAHEFGKNKAKISRSIEVVVAILDEEGPMTDFALREAWSAYWDGPFSYTLPCKARHWAREAGLVKHVGFGEHHNRKVRMWGIGRDDEFLDSCQVCPSCGSKARKAA